MNEEQQQSQSHVRKPSPIKSQIAKEKTRDPFTGKFLSAEEKQRVESQYQQAQFQAERDKFNAVLGRQPVMQPQLSNPMQVQQQFNPQQYMPPTNNFQNILNANKPGSNEDMKRWASLLGKDNISKNKKKDRWRI